MMPHPAIIAERVSVRFRVPTERVRSIKEYAIRRVQRSLNHLDVWALRDVDLTVRRGEVVGVVGRNGAGKSTLLKVIARVLAPTDGRVRVWGRVAPLLELGAGFDFELTGRENIFLNGGMLGYSRRDLAARLDRIVEFSGLADFVDAPIRTYSSGMLARLGFAIATDVPPQVLLLDEILGVGDGEFRARSGERIQEFRRQGASILLVSHSLDSIASVCDRAVWLERGRVVADGLPDDIIAQYKQALQQPRRTVG